MNRTLSQEKRRTRRSLISAPAMYTQGSTAQVEKRKAIRGAAIADMSNSGLGMFSDTELNPGSILEIECREIWKDPRKFTVKWCNRIKHNFYRVGLGIHK